MPSSRAKPFLDPVEGLAVTVASIIHGFDVVGRVTGAGPDSLVLELDHEEVALAEQLHAGDMVRLGWTDGLHWRKGSACVAAFEPDTPSLSLVRAERVDDEELRRGTMRTQSFNALTCAFAEGSELVETRGRTLNVSTGGFAARTNRAIEVRSEAAVLMEMPSGDPIVAVARCVRQGATGTLHMRFTQLGTADRARIATLVTSSERPAGPDL